MGNPPTLKRPYNQKPLCPFCQKPTAQEFIRLDPPYFVMKCTVCQKEFRRY